MCYFDFVIKHNEFISIENKDDHVANIMNYYDIRFIFIRWFFTMYKSMHFGQQNLQV